MESGRNGLRGVCVHSRVVEAKEQEHGHALRPSTGEGRVKDPRLIISLVISLSAQVSLFWIWGTWHLCPCIWSLGYLGDIKSTTFIKSHWKMCPLLIDSWLNKTGYLP